MNQKEIGVFISKCRKEKGLTQSQLAEKLEVSDKSISRWENGKTMPDISLYEPLCDALDIHISELLYAKKMSDDEKTIQGEKSALKIFKTKLQLRTFLVLSEVLTFIGIIITMTLTKELAVTSIEKIVTIVCGGFVWGFGIFLSIIVGKSIRELEQHEEL